jgi:hypothetical protein
VVLLRLAQKLGQTRDVEPAVRSPGHTRPGSRIFTS